MTQTLYIIAAIVTIIGGIGAVVRNWAWIKNILAEWTRRGIKVIYVWVSHDDEETVSLIFYLCGEEKSWLFSDFSYENGNSYILAMKTVRYNPSYDSYSDRGDMMAEWEAQIVRPLSEGPFSVPVLVQLVGKSGFRFEFYTDNDETITFSDSFKFKAELAELRKKYRIKYLKKASGAIGRWKVKNRYPT